MAEALGLHGPALGDWDVLLIVLFLIGVRRGRGGGGGCRGGRGGGHGRSRLGLGLGEGGGFGEGRTNREDRIQSQDWRREAQPTKSKTRKFFFLKKIQ